ncbi:sperm surface protein Sp17-like [Colletes gigas]|uniref:sperm surface protein Sp17-like n=1 Tax=Colletes gigas TaxID=935657 RepID=UPI001C9B6839|nr:sperm surface protein Sp17-like [Colletes gigas]
MDAMLQKHSAKHIYKVPEGLRELCTDISREVLRLQPKNLYGFVAEYVDTLLITRENTKIAVKVVNNILLGSQAILSILYRTGFSLEQIAVAAPRIQRAFREYLDAVDIRPTQTCEEHTCDEEAVVSIRNILEATGSTRETAERAATVIQVRISKQNYMGLVKMIIYWDTWTFMIGRVGRILFRNNDRKV